jgi:hypothetical protein
LVKVVILVGYGWFILTCLVVGARVLRLALRTRQLPEWAMGIVLFVSGGLGYSLLFIRSLAFLPGELKELTFAAGLVALSVGSAALYLFTWRVFRPDSVWALLVFAGALFLMISSYVIELLTTGFGGERSLLWYSVGTVTRAIPYGWVAVESLHHHARLRRSLRFGLADPMVVDRFRLWGLGAAAIFANFALVYVSGLIGDPTSHPPALVALLACLGIPAAIAMALAFHPPAFYRRRFTRQHPAPTRPLQA